MDVDMKYNRAVTNTIFKTFLPLQSHKKYYNDNYIRNFTDNYKNRLIHSALL